MTAFALTDPAKDDPALVDDDRRHFAALEASLARALAAASDRLDAVRLLAGGHGEQALERDLEAHRLSARVDLLRRWGIEITLGRMVPASGDPVWVGRFGVVDDDGERLLLDWRSPAAEPFFAATHADPRGLVSRRRYRWASGRVVDFWDEVFTADARDAERAALDDQSAFIASLGDARSPRMRDVLATIQSDQDAIIRARSDGALVVDGGPGTGKTVVALHRAAYLMYADARTVGGGGVLFVGPHDRYLAYVSDVLPSLGEDAVQTCTLRDLVPEGASAVAEPVARVAALKADSSTVRAVQAAVRVFEEPPERAHVVSTPWADVVLHPDDWADAFAAAEPGTPHNDAREQVWDAVVEIVAGRLAEVAPDVPERMLRRAVAADAETVRVFSRAWPTLEAGFVVESLWTVPALLRRCAPHLEAADAALLRRPAGEPWTEADLPLLDAARDALGDPDAARRRRSQERRTAVERRERARVAEDMIAADDGDLRLMSMLGGADVQFSLVDRWVDDGGTDMRLDRPFAHVIVDEAQELTDAQWAMVRRRCPSGSVTIVGDRAQARAGFPESWEERLARVGLSRVARARLRVNYRTPMEVMAVAEPEIRAAIPDANVPESVRHGAPVRHGSVSEAAEIVDAWVRSHPAGTVGVIARDGRVGVAAGDRVSVIDPIAAKGLEFDLVVVVDPDGFGDDVTGAVDRYVAMTRATGQLVLLAPQR